MANSENQNDFSKGSVVGNILSLALPMTLAQLINILYNIIDRMYIGRLPENATLSLTGLGLCLPIISIVIAFANLSGKTDLYLTCIAVNLAATGGTVFAMFLLTGEKSTTSAAIRAYTLPSITIPLIDKIPLIGPMVSGHNILTYFAFICVFLVWFFLYRTRMGLRMRAVGENPQACDTVGINVYRVRYGTILFSGALAGLAGAYVSMGQLSSFTEDMIAGRGFIALAAVVLGNYMPGGVLAATLIFGAASALQYRMQATAVSVPYQFWLMLPYIITIIAICLYRKSSNQAASSGKPYDKH